MQMKMRKKADNTALPKTEESSPAPKAEALPEKKREATVLSDKEEKAEVFSEEEEKPSRSFFGKVFSPGLSEEEIEENLVEEDTDPETEEEIEGYDFSGIRGIFFYGIFFSFSVFFCECVLKVYVYRALFQQSLLVILLFSVAYGLICAVITALFRGIPGRIVGFLLLALTVLWMMIQTVYYSVFDTFFTLYSFSGAGDVAEFWKSALDGILSSALPLLLMVIPFVLFFLLRPMLKNRVRAGIWAFAVVLVLATAAQVCATVTVYRDDDDVMSAKYLYTKTFIPQLAVDHFGALTTFRLDLKNLVFGMDDTATADAYEAEEARKRVQEGGADNGNYADNVLDIDFNALAEKETNGTIKDMDEYFASITPSSQNAYTGMFEGKNLIWIVAEGFSTWAINEELTPNLAKMSKECFVFENYYNPIWGVSTSDGEYTVCTGLLPKAGVWSMSNSARNDMAFCMGNQLLAKGYLCNAYHDHSYSYYNRDASHPNMGYEYIAKGRGLDVMTQWPESDVEMMEKTVCDYATKEPFHVYYMTVSGHLEYNFGGNAMSQKHKDEVADLPYSTAGKAYIACQIELDNAIGVLLDSLKKAGTLDDTLIVLSGDHYPYGLTKGQIDELNGSEVEKNFELFHSTLIIWNSAMAANGETVKVEKPCYSVDILPTVSNLMGVPYDSRLLMGRDVFSSASPLVVFANHSWLTDKGRYNAVKREFIPAEGVSVKEDYAQNMMDKVNSMFTYSAKILDNDYYSHVVPEKAAQSVDSKENDKKGKVSP